jgi:hypothetical protein
MKHNSCLYKNVLSNKKSLTAGLFIILFSVAQFAFARDLSAGVKEVESQLTTIMYIAGPVAFMIAAGMFYFSRQLGMDRLVAAVIGTVVFMASKTLFVFFERAFH